MKKLLLLLAAGSIALNVGAQERQMSAMSVMEPSTAKLSKTFPTTPRKVANKTTAGGSRWINYGAYLDTTQILAGNKTSFTGILMWQDTIQSGLFSTGLSHINMVSEALIIDPSSRAFNDSEFFQGEMKISPSDAYVIDSVQITGVYDFNPSKTGVVDTIRLSFVQGTGAAVAGTDVFGGSSLAGGGHYGTPTFWDVRWDSVKNYLRSGTAYGTPSSNVQDIILNNSGTSPAWGDTTSNGIWVRTIKLNTPLSVPANSNPAISISFVSGDPALPTALPGDTIFSSTMQKYNMFRPLVQFAADFTSGDATWAPYDSSDHTVGLFKKLPGFANGWTNTYIPLWAWSTSNGTAASSLQYPDVSWHVTCATCGVITNTAAVHNVNSISKISAFPNPATNELNIPFTLSQSANVTVSLTNAIGQVVATQYLGTVTSGKAVFNTTVIPSGVYVYTVIANGERSTGRVSIAH